MPNEQHIRSSLQASLQVGTAFLVAGTQEIERLEKTQARLIEALDIAEGYIRDWADRGDAGAQAALRMIVERRAIQDNAPS